VTGTLSPLTLPLMVVPALMTPVSTGESMTAVPTSPSVAATARCIPVPSTTRCSTCSPRAPRPPEAALAPYQPVLLDKDAFFAEPMYVVDVEGCRRRADAEGPVTAPCGARLRCG
jgi:hypothetical protein